MARYYRNLSFAPQSVLPAPSYAALPPATPEHAMPSPVSQIPAADSASALAHFEAALSFETDCWDVHESMTSGAADFVLLDVRSHELFAKGHVPGAVSLPHL